MAQVLHKFEVKETVESFGDERKRKCVVTMSLLSDEQLRELGVTRERVMNFIEKK